MAQIIFSLKYSPAIVYLYCMLSSYSVNMQALIKPTGVSVIGGAIRTCLFLVLLPILTVAISFVLKVS